MQESQAFIDNMWRQYSYEGLLRRERPSFEKLCQMIKAKLKERIESFDAQFYLILGLIFYFVFIRNKLLHKVLWLIFR